MVKNRGPIGLLRLELGIRGRGKFGCTELISESTRCKQLHEVRLEIARVVLSMLMLCRVWCCWVE